jgi:hypothetical protein
VHDLGCGSVERRRPGIASDVERRDALVLAQRMWSNRDALSAVQPLEALRLCGVRLESDQLDVRRERVPPLVETPPAADVGDDHVNLGPSKELPHRLRIGPPGRSSDLFVVETEHRAERRA